MTIANQAGASFRADLNNMASALVSQSSGTTAPTTTYAFQLWADTTTNLLKIRNSANSGWITIGPLADLGIQSGVQTAATGAGTADAITATFTPNITALTHGLRVSVTGCSANTTTTPTFAAGTTTATGIVKGANSAVAAGDVLGTADLEYSSTYGKWVLLNPATGVSSVPALGRRTAQIQTFQTGAFASGTTQIPLDDTIPQNTEGDQYLSQVITPTNAASTLEIEVVMNGAPSGAGQWIAALFQDSTANALAATVSPAFGSNQWGQTVIRHSITAGTTSTTTFKVRAGPSQFAAGSFYFNGSAGARSLGGVMASRITIKEYLP